MPHLLRFDRVRLVPNIEYAAFNHLYTLLFWFSLPKALYFSDFFDIMSIMEQYMEPEAAMKRKYRALFCLKILLYIFTLSLLIWKLSAKEWDHAGLCLLSLALYSLPALIARIFHAALPPLLEGICICFAAAANLGGELLSLYLSVPLWDSALHFLWGILAAVIGYAMPDLLGRREGISQSLPRAAAVLMAASFAMLTAVLWEFVEYAVDLWMHTDMQKDSWVYCISSVLLQEEGMNKAVTEEIESVILNGKPLPAYLDIGLHDTIHDMLWTFAGAIVGSALVLSDKSDRFPARLLHALKPTPNSTLHKDGSTGK